MGKLYDAKLKLERAVAEKNLNKAEVLGKVSLKSGVMLALVGPATPDDANKLEKLRSTALALYKIEL
jgi:hypothetical protein